MDDLLSDFPPLRSIDEPPAEDPDLEAAGLAKVTGGGSLQVHLIGWFTSLNETFGPVLRVDFHDGNPHFPFRAVVWRKLDGELTAMVATLDDSTPVAA